MKKKYLVSIVGILLSALCVAQTRVVLIEQFTNAGCPPCAASSPGVFNYANTHPDDAVVIAYHTSFPYNDSMYFENPTDSDSRVAYYGVPGVPYSIVDGNYYENSSNAFLPVIASTVNTRKSAAPRYAMEALSLNLTGNQLTGSFQYTSLNASNTTDSLVTHIVAIEKNVLKSSYSASPGANTENQYGYVMRKMIPDADGTALMNKALNSKGTVSFNIMLSNVKNNNELRLVAFVQNKVTKEVYQSQLYTPQITPLSVHEQTLPLAGNLVIYPNPAVNNISVSFHEKQFIKSIRFFNQLGELLQYDMLNTNTDLIALELSLQPGIYFVKISNTDNDFFQKIIITK
ncbi:MAG: T9SS type A sorting domain-containing protein [Bacteroidota bacterium]